jgi:hypothetical protein
MSKNDNNANTLSESLPNNQGSSNPSGQPGSGGNKPPENQKGKPEFPTIEEHAKKLNVDESVLAAVMQSKQWASGKRVPEAAFKKAVDDFNGAPMGAAAKGGA